VWVYCGGGFRAAIAASLLSGAGVRVTLIDQPFTTAEEAGLTTRDTPTEVARGPIVAGLSAEIP
jgi:rhodanese-related sulfurtransferase